MEAMFARQFAEIFRGGAGDRLGGLEIRKAVASGGERLRQNDELCLLFSSLFNERRKLPATVHRIFSTLGPVVDRG